MTRWLFSLVTCVSLASQFASAQPTDEVGAPPRTDRDYLPPPVQDLGRKQKIKVVYLIAKDREPARNYQAKLEVLTAFVQDVFRRDLAAKGYTDAARGPDFEFADGRLHVRLLRSDKPASHFNFEPNYSNEPKVFDRIMPEVEAAYGPMTKNFYLVLAETYAEGPWKFEWPGTFALGGYRSAVGGGAAFSAWILRDELCATTIAQQVEWLADTTPLAGRIAHGHGQPNSPRFEFIEDGFGAVCHELGHAFGCPHDTRRDDQYIMGNGFRRLRVNYLGRLHRDPPMVFSRDNARLLAASRFLNDKADDGDDEPPFARVNFPTRVDVGATAFQVSVQATDNAGLAAVVFFDKRSGTVRGGAVLADKRHELTLDVAVPKLERGELPFELIFADRGGNLAWASGRIQVGDPPPAEKPQP